MRSWILATAALLFVGIALPALAEDGQPDGAGEVPVAEAAPAAESAAGGESASATVSVPEGGAIAVDSEAAVRWENFEDPGFDPTEAGRAAAEAEPLAEGQNGSAVVRPVEAAAGATEVRVQAVRTGHSVKLGPKGVDSEGRVGRIHTVVVGDTLWDISDAYLGTPWVWPSVWQDNREIANPHLINPSDLIWITSTMMRPVTEEEASLLLSEASRQVEGEEEIAAIEKFAEDPADLIDAEEIVVPDSMGELPVGVAGDANAGKDTGRTIGVPRLRDIGMVSETQLEAATSILGTAEEKTWLSQLDIIYLGLGQGDVHVGETFVLFRNSTLVNDPKTGRFLGYYVNVLGRAEVIEVQAESSVAVIRSSVDGSIIGDRALRDPKVPWEVAIKVAEAGIEGAIAFLPASRSEMGSPDYVYLDVGKVHGLEVGSDLEVYDWGPRVHEPVNNRPVKTPDLVVADLVVVRVEEESSVAYVVGTRRELEVGDAVRTSTVYFPAAF
jgi:hypothetical protein